MSLFGLHRRRRGAIVGHLALFEMTSSVPNRRYADGLRRLGFGDDATDVLRRARRGRRRPRGDRRRRPRGRPRAPAAGAVRRRAVGRPGASSRSRRAGPRTCSARGPRDAARCASRSPRPRPPGSGLDSRAWRRRRPSPTETWDAFFSDFYLRAYAADQRDAAAREQALAAARLSGCPDGGELLDVPCGFGRHALALAEAGFRVTGVDRSPTLLDEARRRVGDARLPKLVRADYRDLPFPDDSFDAALNLFSSLGYLGDEEDTRALGEIGRVLRPDARLVIETMHRDVLVRRFAEQRLAPARPRAAAARAAHLRPRLRRRADDADAHRGAAASASRARSPCACTRPPSCSRCSTRAGYAEARCYGRPRRRPVH